MGVIDAILSFLAAWGVPTAATGFFVWLLKKHIDKKDKGAEAREQAREEADKHQVLAIMAAIELSEATAKAVQRIPDAHCNGDMHAALEYSRKTKQKLNHFLTSQGIHALHDDT